MHALLPPTKKIWKLLGPEFGKDKGQKAIIVTALYGLKSARAAFQSHMDNCMRHLGYEANKADPNIWKVCTRGTINGPKSIIHTY